MRRLVSGVRSSWLASVTSCLWARDRERVDHGQKLVARLPSSPVSVDATRLEVLGAGDSSAVSRSRSTGASAARATPPEDRGRRVPTSAKRSRLERVTRTVAVSPRERAG